MPTESRHVAIYGTDGQSRVRRLAVGERIILDELTAVAITPKNGGGAYTNVQTMAKRMFVSAGEPPTHPNPNPKRMFVCR